MKKKAVSLLVVLALLVSGVCAAAVEISPMWTYLNLVIKTLTIEDGDLNWGATANAYYVPEVTSVKVEVKLQRYGTSWTTIASDTDTEDGTYAAAGGSYTNWTTGQKYRLVTTVTIYDGSTMIEQVGPSYNTLNT